MRIAYYESDDFEKVRNLFMEHYNNEHYGCQFTEEKAAAYLEEAVNSPRFVGFLLLDEEERLIGMSLCQERTWWQYDELHINEFIVAPSHQQKGYGSKLLNFMQKHAKERELAGVTLVTNTLPLAKFYQKNKFSEHDIYFMYKGVEEKAH